MWKSKWIPLNILHKTFTNKTLLQQNNTSRVNNILKRSCFGVLLKKLLRRKISIFRCLIYCSWKTCQILFYFVIVKLLYLTYIEPMFHFWVPWKILWFPYVSRMPRNGNGLRRKHYPYMGLPILSYFSFSGPSENIEKPKFSHVLTLIWVVAG